LTVPDWTTVPVSRGTEDFDWFAVVVDRVAGVAARAALTQNSRSVTQEVTMKVALTMSGKRAGSRH